jgi:lipopolysaccharide transport system ATP-binding protein
MDRGKAKYTGTDVSKAIDLYYTRFDNNESKVVLNDGSLSLLEAKIIDQETNEPITSINWGQDLVLMFTFNVLKIQYNFSFSIAVLDKEQRPVALFRNYKLNTNENKIKFRLVHKNLQLSKGVYSLNLNVFEENYNNPILKVNDIIKFQVIQETDIWAPFLLDAEYVNNY